MVGNIRVTNVKSTEISLAWDAPNDPFNNIEMYEARYFVKGSEKNATSMLTKTEELVLNSLRQRTEYGFQVLFLLSTKKRKYYDVTVFM